MDIQTRLAHHFNVDKKVIEKCVDQTARALNVYNIQVIREIFHYFIKYLLVVSINNYTISNGVFHKILIKLHEFNLSQGDKGIIYDINWIGSNSGNILSFEGSIIKKTIIKGNYPNDVPVLDDYHSYNVIVFAGNNLSKWIPQKIVEIRRFLRNNTIAIFIGEKVKIDKFQNPFVNIKLLPVKQLKSISDTFTKVPGFPFFYIDKK